MIPETTPIRNNALHGDLPEATDFESALLPGETRLVVDLQGYEGPLDLMLDLARRNKLDLRAISILMLADQYIAFIQQAQSLRLELAGDYLVMAAWLTYLKSRLMLPEPASENMPTAETLAEDLAARLIRLETIRKAGAVLAERLEDARNCLPRGAGEAVIVQHSPAWDVQLSDLLNAYMLRRLANARSGYRVAMRTTLSIPDARALLTRLIGHHADWCPIDVLIAAMAPATAGRRSALASGFAAALELAREGEIELRQEQSFATLYLLGRAGTAAKEAS